MIKPALRQAKEVQLRLQRDERRFRILIHDAHLQGHTYREIAAHLGISLSYTHNLAIKGAISHV